MTIKYERKPLSVPVGAQATVELPPRIFRLKLACMLFDTDKAFLLPSAMHDIRVLKQIYDQHPGLQVLVTGHTDTQAPTDYNQHLSLERALALAAFLTDDADAWMPHYTGTPHSRTWGVVEDQLMLATLPDPQAPFYTGDIDGQLGPATRDAITQFQTARGLAVDGVCGNDTRRALVGDYMAQDGTTLPAGTVLLTHGCGEFHLAVPTGDEVDEPKNRRVEIFLFEGPIDPPPQTPCNGCAEYAQWKAKTSEHINLCEDTGFLDVAVVEVNSTKPIANANVILEGPVSFAAVTGPDGTVRFPSAPPGSYRCRVAANDSSCSFPVTIVAGAPPAQPPTPASQIAPPPSAPPAPKVQNRQSLIGNSNSDGNVSPGAPATSPAAASGAQITFAQAVAQLIGLLELVLEEHPPMLTDEAREGVAKGSRAAWDGTRVMVDYPSMTIFDSGIQSDTVDPKQADVVVLLQDGVGEIRVETVGPHVSPIRWHVSPSTPVVKGGQSPDKRKIAGRLRYSVWAGPEKLDNTIFAGGKDIYDDISLLNTLSIGPFLDAQQKLTFCTSTQQATQFRVDFDPLKFNTRRDSRTFTVDKQTGLKTLQPSTDASSPEIFQTQRDFYRDLIDGAHSNGIQILAGFAMVNGQRAHVAFNEWVRALANGSRDVAGEVKDLATDIAGFLALHFESSQKPGTTAFDGISFDIESIGEDIGGNKRFFTKPEIDDLLRRAQVMTAFYQAMAAIYAPQGKIVAVANAGLVDVNRMDPVAGNQMETATGIAHPYAMAKDQPNMILRPMAYDSETSDLPGINGESPTWKWHERIIRFALQGTGLHPGQFQLGVKTIQGQHGGEVLVSARRAKRCAEMLAPNRVGYCGFAFGGRGELASAKSEELALNATIADPTTSWPRNQTGSPVQVPFSQDDETRMLGAPDKVNR